MSNNSSKHSTVFQRNNIYTYCNLFSYILLTIIITILILLIISPICLAEENPENISQDFFNEDSNEDFYQQFYNGIFIFNYSEKFSQLDDILENYPKETQEKIKIIEKPLSYGKYSLPSVPLDEITNYLNLPIYSFYSNEIESQIFAIGREIMPIFLINETNVVHFTTLGEDYQVNLFEPTYIFNEEIFVPLGLLPYLGINIKLLPNDNTILFFMPKTHQNSISRENLNKFTKTLEINAKKTSIFSENSVK